MHFGAEDSTRKNENTSLHIELNLALKYPHDLE